MPVVGLSRSEVVRMRRLSGSVRYGWAPPATVIVTDPRRSLPPRARFLPPRLFVRYSRPLPQRTRERANGNAGAASRGTTRAPPPPLTWPPHVATRSTSRRRRGSSEFALRHRRAAHVQVQRNATGSGAGPHQSYEDATESATASSPPACSRGGGNRRRAAARARPGRSSKGRGLQHGLQRGDSFRVVVGSST